MIKRVAALPGDRLPAACRTGPPARPRSDLVPDGMFVVLGDNARVSYDSRLAGPIAADLLIGVVARRIGS